MALEMALPSDSTEPDGLKVLRRLWVAKFDVEEEGRALADKYVETLLPLQAWSRNSYIYPKSMRGIEPIQVLC